MNIKLYVVRLGGKLYVQDGLYNLYQATTSDITNAKFYKDKEKAEKMARKAKGEVVELMLTDEDPKEEIQSIIKARDKALKNYENLKKAFKKIMGQD